MLTAIKVNGMGDGCEEIIERSLSEINGVNNVKTDLEEYTVELDYDLKIVELENIENRIRQLGFRLPSGYCDIDTGIGIEKQELYDKYKKNYNKISRFQKLLRYFR